MARRAAEIAGIFAGRWATRFNRIPIDWLLPAEACLGRRREDFGIHASNPMVGSIPAEACPGQRREISASMPRLRREHVNLEQV